MMKKKRKCRRKEDSASVENLNQQPWSPAATHVNTSWQNGNNCMKKELNHLNKIGNKFGAGAHFSAGCWSGIWSQVNVGAEHSTAAAVEVQKSLFFFIVLTSDYRSFRWWSIRTDVLIIKLRFYMCTCCAGQSELQTVLHMWASEITHTCLLNVPHTHASQFYIYLIFHILQEAIAIQSTGNFSQQMLAYAWITIFAATPPL